MPATGSSSSRASATGLVRVLTVVGALALAAGAAWPATAGARLPVRGLVYRGAASPVLRQLRIQMGRDLRLDRRHAGASASEPPLSAARRRWRRALASGAGSAPARNRQLHERGRVGSRPGRPRVRLHRRVESADPLPRRGNRRAALLPCAAVPRRLGRWHFYGRDARRATPAPDRRVRAAWSRDRRRSLPRSGAGFARGCWHLAPAWVRSSAIRPSSRPTCSTSCGATPSPAPRVPPVRKRFHGHIGVNRPDRCTPPPRVTRPRAR